MGRPPRSVSAGLLHTSTKPRSRAGRAGRRMSPRRSRARVAARGSGASRSATAGRRRRRMTSTTSRAAPGMNPVRPSGSATRTDRPVAARTVTNVCRGRLVPVSPLPARSSGVARGGASTREPPKIAHEAGVDDLGRLLRWLPHVGQRVHGPEQAIDAEVQVWRRAARVPGIANAPDRFATRHTLARANALGLEVRVIQRQPASLVAHPDDVAANLGRVHAAHAAAAPVAAQMRFMKTSWAALNPGATEQRTGSQSGGRGFDPPAVHQRVVFTRGRATRVVRGPQ
jgi:hypothetical protein